jgi:hypothetical protein
MMADLPKGTIPKIPQLIAWAVMHGVGRTQDAATGGVDAVKVLGQEKQLSHAYLWRGCHQTMRVELRQAIAVRNMTSSIPGEIALLIGVDLGKLQAQSVEAIPEPKAWALQYGKIAS